MLLIDTGLLQDAILQAIKDQDLRFLQVNHYPWQRLWSMWYLIKLCTVVFCVSCFSMIYTAALHVPPVWHCTVPGAFVYLGR
jgi:hypothetical protein